MPIQFVPFIPRPRESYDRLLSNRNRIRAELRVKFDARLQLLTGDDAAHMSYTVVRYAKHVVRRHGYKLVGWPASIPFRNLSKLRGGIRVLTALRRAWDDGTLRFERATAKDMEDAACNPPVSVHPNPALISEDDEDDEDGGEGEGEEGGEEKQNDVDKGGSEEKQDNEDEGGKRERDEPGVAIVRNSVLLPLVLHPGDLGVLGRHPIPMQPIFGGSNTVLGKRPRKQRRDVKKPRAKPVRNPLNVPSRRNRRGVTSERFVLEGDGTLESDIEQFSDGELRAPTRKRARLTFEHYWPTSEPLNEFV